jgi:phosphatidate cytidylyltransferase
MTWSPPPELMPVFTRVALVLAFSTAMVAVVSIVRRFARRKDGKDKAASSLWPRAGVWFLIAFLLLSADAAGPVGLSVVMALIAVVACGELARVAHKAGVDVPLRSAQVVTAVIVLAAGFGHDVLLVVLAVVLPAYLFTLILTPENGRLARAYGSLGILVHLALPLVLLVLLRHRPDGFTAFAWIFLVVCFNDVMAMFGGLLVGRTPLLPAISPAKTLEGTLLGLVGAMGAAALMRFGFPAQSATAYYAGSLAIALAGCAGDLAASALKRAAGAKDFGTSLPGHGGVMDRLDSLLFAIPVGYVLLMFWS